MRGLLLQPVLCWRRERYSAALRQLKLLPAPPALFKGQIGLSVKDSKSDFPQPIKAPKEAPNIVLILLDDVGFGASSTFGGPCDTPTLDRLAANRLRYTQFHTTAISSPTRTRCSPAATTTRCTPATSWNLPPAILATTA